ncbi:MAG: SulP family inorganic anion transporter [Gammaproteobacteria bacterium]|nr:SulP family inorganic anion transporter [Gammaproteobacteria bacterium]
MQSRAIVCPLWLVRLFPFIRWWYKVDRQSVRHDLIAGIVGAFVVLPQGVAFAAIAGMPPEYGLYAGMVPAIVAALWGSSWHLVSGPTTAASIVLFSTLSNLAEPGSVEYVRLALTLTFMVGIIQLVMGLAKLGTLVNFISHSVVIGFTAGAAILIAVNQLKHFFGISVPSGAHFYEIILEIVARIDQVNFYILAVGIVTLVTGLLIRRYMRKIPYMIVAIIVGSMAAIILDAIYGHNITGIVTVGALPASLPPLSAPDFTLSTIKELAPATLAATLFALVEAVSIARSLAIKSGQHIDGNQEFVGQGLSNIAGSFFSGYVATGSFNRSGVNYEAGAKTPLAAVFAGGLLVIIVLFVAPYASYLPNATMAAILFLVAWGLIDFHHIKRILKHSHTESTILLTTFFGTLFLELEFAILLGVILSLVLYLHRTSRPKIYARVPDPRLPRRKFNTDATLPECPQLKLVRIDGSLFFGAISHVRETLVTFEQQNPGQKNLLLLAQGINFVDLAGAEFLENEAERRRETGGRLFLYRVKEGVSQTLRKDEAINTIGEENIFYGKEEALSTIVNKHLDKSICAQCNKRIFLECEYLPKPQN